MGEKRQTTKKPNKKSTPKKAAQRYILITRSLVNTSVAKETKKVDFQANNYLNQPLKIMTTVTIMTTGRMLVQLTEDGLRETPHRS